MVTETEFKEFLLLQDHDDHNFLPCLKKCASYEIAFDFLYTVLDKNTIRTSILSGKSVLLIQHSLTEFTKVLAFFKKYFDNEFVKTLLMKKYSDNENFLLDNCYMYISSEKVSDLLELFDTIFLIFGADFELFNDLFYLVPQHKYRNINNTFFDELKEKLKNEELNLFIDWIEKNLGHGFLKN
jgi:hypothetical protein